MKNMIFVSVFAFLFLCVIGCSGRHGARPIAVTDTTTDVHPVSTDTTNAEPDTHGKKFADALGLHKVYFEYDAADLGEDSRVTLRNNAQWVDENIPNVLLVEGHCDERGTTEYNLALGQKRATMVRNYLIGLGIQPAKISTISYGKEKPTALGQNEESWAQNRRAEFSCLEEK